MLLATTACHFSTSELPKVVRDRQFFSILTCKCASRYSGVQFLDIATSKSGPNLTCFVHFDFKMCFSLQRRAIFQHLNFKKWSEPVSFLTFDFEMCFSPQTSKSGPRPSVFYDFDLKMCFSLQRRAIFPHLNFKKWSEPDVFCTF